MIMRTTMQMKKETMDRFFQSLKKSECDKESAYNRGVRNISKKMQREIDAEAEEYITGFILKKQNSKIYNYGKKSGNSKNY